MFNVFVMVQCVLNGLYMCFNVVVTLECVGCGTCDVWNEDFMNLEITIARYAYSNGAIICDSRAMLPVFFASCVGPWWCSPRRCETFN